MRRLHTKKRPPTKELSFSLMGIAAIMNIAVARCSAQRVIVRVCRVLPTRCTPVTNFGYFGLMITTLTICRLSSRSYTTW